MRYQREIVINLPRQRVIELFDDPENLTKWQPTLQRFEHLSGEPGQPGAKSRLVYLERGRELEMIETITTRNLPAEFSGTYEAKGVKNTNINHFYEEDGKTRWVVDTAFEFSGWMKLMGLFMRGAFPKQTYDFMQKFKAFAENAA